jgi:hypothetical protein
MIQRCLEKDPARRYQSVADLHADLDELQQEMTSGVHTLPAMPKGVGRRPYVLAAAAIVAAASVALYWGMSDAEAPAAFGEAEFTQLTDAAGQELFPSLSPDGRTIVYASAASGNYDIYSQRVGGQNPLNLTKNSPADETHPAYSADGERIAFRSERNGGGIYLAGATGESVRRVTNFGYHPAWSPDGTQLAVVTQSVTDPGLRFTSSELWIVTIASGERRLLTDADAAQPGWSPSGRRVVYWTRRGASAAGDIWSMGVDGSAPVAITTDPAIDWNPVWSRDGYVYFSSNRGGSMNLWRVRVDENTGAPSAGGDGGRRRHEPARRDFSRRPPPRLRLARRLAQPAARRLRPRGGGGARRGRMGHTLVPFVRSAGGGVRRTTARVQFARQAGRHLRRQRGWHRPAAPDRRSAQGSRRALVA